MIISCLNIINDLNNAIADDNLELINNMINQDTVYEYVCIKPDITYEFYYKQLREKWDKIVNDFINEPNKCSTFVKDIYKLINPKNIEDAKKIFKAIENADEKKKSIFESIDIENMVFDFIASELLKPNKKPFTLSKNLFINLKDLSKILVENCQCQVIDIFKFILTKYKKRYIIRFEGYTKDQVINALRDDYEKYKKMLEKFNINKAEKIENNLFKEMINSLTEIYSLENELNTLIPAELGSLKEFFIKIITTYYENLAPIIWAQIFQSITKNIFIDLPFSYEELFSFFSKQLLLNSGPFILKILQTIRPILSPKLAKKYNLEKLTYPLLKPNEVNLILSKVVYNWDYYEIIQNYSASVGHVVKVLKVNDPANPFMIKIIKPLAVAQSCWEFKTLYNIFPENSCNRAFVQELLQSNGEELNTMHEIININEGYQKYTTTYKEVFNIDLNAYLTTIQNIPNIIIPDTWFALTMTTAPGIALSYLIENELIKHDTKYRAKLHRCLDLLVYKFFYNIIRSGFYHSDLHAGNIFFSFEKSQITLIDFGSIGRLDVYSNDEYTKKLLDILVMSIFNNYDEILDTMTELVNSKCLSTQIDTTTPEYQKLKEELYFDRIETIKNIKIQKANAKLYNTEIFSPQRIQEERTDITPPKYNPIYINSIYSYLEYQPREKETIIENKEILPPIPKGETLNTVNFVSVLEKIIKFYALSGVNIAIKFNEFYQFQKAYLLLLGVLHNVGYNSYRIGIAIKKAILNWNNVPELLHVDTIINISKTYYNENNKYKQFIRDNNLNN